MASDDIYGNKGKYERFKANLSSLVTPPSSKGDRRGIAKYYCQNPANLEYFRTLFRHFEARDLSYIRRNRVLQSMRLISHLTEKDLAACTRTDIDAMLGAMHEIYRTPKSKETFIHDLKSIFRVLFPEQDEYGRPDETLTPYVVRHVSGKVDRSTWRLRQDRLTWAEFERLVAYFARDPRIQAYLTLALESLARPQELLYVRLRDVELHDNFAKIYVSEHGKEGPGLLQCIDSYPYLVKWLDIHPHARDRDSFVFINTGHTRRGQQLKPTNINKLIRQACTDLDIHKPVTCYSLKRNGVTMRRLRGETDMEIQHAARWTSTDQLKTYDLSHQEDAFKKELEKRGLIPGTDGDTPKTRTCGFCNATAGFAETFCPGCKRPLNRDAIKTEATDRRTDALTQELATLKQQFAAIKRHLVPNLMNELLTQDETKKEEATKVTS